MLQPEMLQPETCIPCYGTGWLEFNGKPVRCSYCNGTGLSRFTRKQDSTKLETAKLRAMFADKATGHHDVLNLHTTHSTETAKLRAMFADRLEKSANMLRQAIREQS